MFYEREISGVYQLYVYQKLVVDWLDKAKMKWKVEDLFKDMQGGSMYYSGMKSDKSKGQKELLT